MVSNPPGEVIESGLTLVGRSIPCRNVIEGGPGSASWPETGQHDHRQLNDEELRAADLVPNTIRPSVCIEDADQISDLERMEWKRGL